MPDVSTRKDDLRRRFRAARAALDESTYLTKSQAITTLAGALPEIDGARTVHVYWPMVDRREVDSRPLVHRLHAQNKQIVLPVVLTFERSAPSGPRMRHVRFPGTEALEVNPWGIYEPTGGTSVSLDELDVVVVPALGAGRNGHRIGHGFGYYDEFLHDLDVPRVCLVYDACLVDEVPHDAHDVPMTVVVTEREVVRPAPA